MQRSPCHPHEGSLPVLSFPQGAQKWAPRPLIQILGVLRGWSATVGGCPLAERRATIHPPGSCNPKGEGTKSLGTMQPAASGWEWGGACRVPSLAFLHSEEALFGCRQAPYSKKVCLCFTWQRHGRSSLGSTACLPEQPGVLLVYSPIRSILERPAASLPKPQAGTQEVEAGTGCAIHAAGGAGA